ncbi:MAG: 4'-phosphopantetheinyl transferase superfamily protein [Rhodobacterales bacterium]|nr:4'-phosphopantetheinyl transferase superfamily protein [Rhodobacterales bacterium]
MSIPVDLWRWRLIDPDPRALSADEHARAARFVFARDRDRYIAGRARLRNILGQYLGRAPGDIVFHYGPYGRPEVDGIGFNLAHTGDTALLAVATGPVLGVDIEAPRAISMDVAEAHFSKPEIAALKALPREQQIDGFYRCWTRKEAYLKARGTGISTDLASFAVTLGPAEPPRLLTCASGDADVWSLYHLAPAPGLVGALAIRSAGQAVMLNWRN